MYISVPIGIERLEFDAHRVFNPYTLLELFNDECKLMEFSYIYDNNILHLNGDIDVAKKLNFGCGLFHFKKREY